MSPADQKFHPESQRIKSSCIKGYRSSAQSKLLESPKPILRGQWASLPPLQTPPWSYRIFHRCIRQDLAMGARPLEELSRSRARYCLQHLSPKMLWSWVLHGRQGYRNSLAPPRVQLFLQKIWSPGKISALFYFNILTLRSKLPRRSSKHAFPMASYGVKPALTTVTTRTGSKCKQIKTRLRANQICLTSS